MMKQFERLSVWAHGGALVGAFAIWQVVRVRLDAMYAASKHPVDYATGQTTFDAAQIKGFYGHMTGEGTLNVYVATQQFDFLFMLMIAVFGVLLGTFVARFGAIGSWGRWFGLAAAGLAVAGALMDALENAVSFVMLANPAGFAPWLAFPYSGFAVVKFMLLTLAMAAVLLGCVFVIQAKVSSIYFRKGVPA